MTIEPTSEALVELCKLAENELGLKSGQKFAAIIGLNPSKGARSPVLWNAAFHAHGVDAEMIPIDVEPRNLEALMEAVEESRSYIGGAVAVPYKETIANWLGKNLTPEAAKIGAVNCLYRTAEGKLEGTNTDGEAALKCFEMTNEPVAGKSVLVLGPGGAGKAVAMYFAKAVGSKGQLTIAGRSATGKSFADRLGASWIGWANIGGFLSEVDVLVNCTSVGSGDQSRQSPLTVNEVSQLPRHAVVFDIIYQPSPTQLLRLANARGLKVMDGLEMNLEQAILAYGHAAPQPRGAEITKIAMEAAKATA